MAPDGWIEQVTDEVDTHAGRRKKEGKGQKEGEDKERRISEAFETIKMLE